MRSPPAGGYAIASVTFALQNSAPVAVQFLGWRRRSPSQTSLDYPMGLILLITFSFGVLFGFVVSLFPAIKGMRKRSELTRKIEQQTSDIEDLNRQLTEATHQIQMLQSAQPQHYLPEDTSPNAYIE